MHYILHSRENFQKHYDAYETDKGTANPFYTLMESWNTGYLAKWRENKVQMEPGNISYLEKQARKQCRPISDCSSRSSLIKIFTVCYSDKHLVKQKADWHILPEISERSVRNFRVFIIPSQHASSKKVAP